MFLAEGIDGQVIVVILMVLFAGVKALIEKLQNKGAAPAEYQEEDYEGYEVEEDYDEYARQLREQREEILRRQQEAAAPPPLPSSVPAPTPRQPEVYLPAKVKKPNLSKAEQEALANFQRSTPRRARRSETITARARARRVLASPYAARDAIVLSEILGKPKGLRDNS